jgi:hypothetical protein
MAGACATHQAPPAPPEAVVDLNASGEPTTTKNKTRVRVENQNLAEMTVYVYRGSQRLRLGRVAANGVTNLNIPSSIVAGGMTQVRFFAEPLGSSRGILSEVISVSPGDRVDFTIPTR